MQHFKVQSDLVDGDLGTTVKPAGHISFSIQGVIPDFISLLKRNNLPNFGESVVDAVVTGKGCVVGRVAELEFSTRKKLRFRKHFSKIQGIQNR